MAQEALTWEALFQEIARESGSTKPPAFYEKCKAALEQQDIYAPEDLKYVDPAAFDVPSITAGMRPCLTKTVDIVKARYFSSTPISMSCPSMPPPTQTTSTLPTNSTMSLPRSSTMSLSRSSTLSLEPLETVEFQIPEGQLSVASVILPGHEDCAKIMRRGGVEVKWRDKTVKKFIETTMPKYDNSYSEDADNYCLPTLYLQFLDKEFLVKGKEYDPNLRAGNDNSEIQLVLPHTMIPNLPDSTYDGNFGIVKNFLVAHAEVMSSALEAKGIDFSGRASGYKGIVDPNRYYFALRTARPKAEINLDKARFGIPANAELYMFAENHASVPHMSADETDAFERCIEEMPENDNESVAKFGTFLKVFYEGGFGYNEKQVIGRGYLPKTVAIACMTVKESRHQGGIGTGFPYRLHSAFLPFKDTVPVTIRSITDMSPWHKRYGFCFTRCVFVWETQALAEKGALNFCSILPHGGFYYVPASISEHRRIGGLLYSFGEARENPKTELSH